MIDVRFSSQGKRISLLGKKLPVIALSNSMTTRQAGDAEQIKNSIFCHY
jgi:hypothetical protein